MLNHILTCFLVHTQTFGRTLIPSYEPNSILLELLQELKKYNLKIVIVNDGSTFEYNSIFNEAKKYAEVLVHKKNQGKGRALKTGLSYLEQTIKKDYIVVTMDCDGQHKVSDAIRLSQLAEKHPETLILGKRLRSKKTPLRSRVGNAITRGVYHITTHLDVYDTQTGLRAFSNQLVPWMLMIEGERFEYEMNVLLYGSMQKIPIKEIEIETIYMDKNSNSHFHTIKDSILIYKEIFKFFLSSFCCFLIDYLLYSIFLQTSNHLILSNIFARGISATINYHLNKRKVFCNLDKSLKQVWQYWLLVGFLLLGNTLLLNGLVTFLFLNRYIAKIITEMILFAISWFYQKKFIFKKEEKDVPKKI